MAEYLDTVKALRDWLSHLLKSHPILRTCSVFALDGDCLRDEHFLWTDSEGSEVPISEATNVNICIRETSRVPPPNSTEHQRRTPWEIAEAWYSEQEIAGGIGRAMSITAESHERLPADVLSPEFAKWLTHQYRLAMAKGIQLGRDGSED